MASDAEDATSSEAEQHQDDKILSRKTDSNASSDGLNGKSRPNDPSRPRRKKARRACFACQRAHLTCGDERPCQRCIKRGLQDACQDGIRKKAKYLHDAPAEALIPPALGGTYNLNGNSNSNTSTQQGPMMQAPIGAAQPPMYYNNPQSMNTDMFSQVQNAQQMQPQHPTSANNSFGAHPPQTYNNGTQQSSTMQAPQAPLQQNQNLQYPFDPSDPAFFNFDISNLNFGNHFGAMEFGMLEHMSSGAIDRRAGDMMNMGHQQQYHNPSIAEQQPQSQQPQRQASLLFGRDAMMDVDWETQKPGPQTHASLATPNNTPIIQTADRAEPSGPPAYAIGARPNSLASASPISITQDIPPHDLNSPSLFSTQNPSAFGRNQTSHHTGSLSAKGGDSLAQSHIQAINPRKQAHDGDYIYDSVKQPYPYTKGFHRLLDYITTHFARDKINRIARALAAIRPALITFAQQLTEKDLIFMEVGVQRKLFTYDVFIKSYGTPTVIARRDGAIVAVSQEFVILTGWSKDVLLGKKPNLNTNHGGVGSGGTSTIGTNSGRGTRRPSAEPESNGTENANSTSSKPGAAGHASSKSNTPQSVLVAEIMSQDTVAEFYEDYARLAFGDPMGRAMRRGKLLKYKTTTETYGPMDRAAEAIGKVAANGSQQPDHSSGTSTKAKNDKSKKSSSKDEHDKVANGSRIAGENAFVRLGEKEGVVDCMYCWNVRRDNFEVPQLIVMNFLPVISPHAP